MVAAVGFGGEDVRSVRGGGVQAERTDKGANIDQRSWRRGLVVVDQCIQQLKDVGCAIRRRVCQSDDQQPRRGFDCAGSSRSHRPALMRGQGGSVASATKKPPPRYGPEAGRVMTDMRATVAKCEPLLARRRAGEVW